MTPVRDLADELRLSNVSIRYHCRTRGIETFRRLPDGARGGQMTIEGVVARLARAT